MFFFSFLFSWWFCHCIFINLLSNAFSGICLILLSLSGEFPKWEWNLGRKKVAWYLGGTSNDYCVINAGNKLSQYLSKKRKKKLSQYNNKTYILRTESRRQRMVFISYNIEVIELIECLKRLGHKNVNAHFFILLLMLRSWNYMIAENVLC